MKYDNLCNKVLQAQHALRIANVEGVKVLIELDRAEWGEFWEDIKSIVLSTGWDGNVGTEMEFYGAIVRVRG